MTAPSSPVPAVERIELPGGWYFQQLNPPHGVLYALRTPKGQGFGVNGTGMSVGRPVVEAFAATLNATPTPGRAAEPDTMGEVERLAETWKRAIIDNRTACVGAKIVEAAETAFFSAVRTIVTERDYERARRIVLSSIAEKAHAHNAALRTRAETAEAKLATADREREQIALAICGGEDAPGYAASLSVDDLKRVIADRLDSKEWTDRQIAALDALSNPEADQ